MSRKHTLKPSAAPAQQPLRRAHVSDRDLQSGTYTITQVCQRTSLARSTFYRLRDAGELPFLEEVRPRIGKRARYRADLIEQWVAGNWQTFSKAHATNGAASHQTSGSPLIRHQERV